jgi:hypothetical protein
VGRALLVVLVVIVVIVLAYMFLSRGQASPVTGRTHPENLGGVAVRRDLLSRRGSGRLLRFLKSVVGLVRTSLKKAHGAKTRPGDIEPGKF